ncbi:hypothetical protein GGS24DRAFT_224256 [Hypoxylon argillaceum]|nr:hypothetical protein GGS24DRAFT_224256 [Hypoxylon argillaceum]
MSEVKKEAAAAYSSSLCAPRYLVPRPRPGSLAPTPACPNVFFFFFFLPYAAQHSGCCSQAVPSFDIAQAGLEIPPPYIDFVDFPDFLGERLRTIYILRTHPSSPGATAEVSTCSRCYCRRRTSYLHCIALHYFHYLPTTTYLLTSLPGLSLPLPLTTSPRTIFRA